MIRPNKRYKIMDLC